MAVRFVLLKVFWMDQVRTVVERWCLRRSERWPPQDDVMWVAQE